MSNKVACLQDIPLGGIINRAGIWCYDTQEHCVMGTNACDQRVPCTATPSTICATAGNAKHKIFCPADYPVDITKGVTTQGDICYRNPLSCMRGPNACNTSVLCEQDKDMTSNCKGARSSKYEKYSWYCSLNTQFSAVIVSSVEMTSPASTLTLLCAGLLLAVPGVRV